MSDSLGSDVAVSSVRSGDSNPIKKTKKVVEKASKIKIDKEGFDSSQSSVKEDSEFNSDVSSLNIN